MTARRFAHRRVDRAPSAAKEQIHHRRSARRYDVCLTSLGKKECDACELACPYDAVKITWDEAQYSANPIVNDKCIGCGACEVVCPATPVKAIRVWTLKPLNFPSRMSNVFSPECRSALQAPRTLGRRANRRRRDES